MTLRPLVSIILPTYNRAATLPRSIGSVFKQSFSDYELIVIDDGSTDETYQLLVHYGNHPQVRILSTPHRGSSHARNIGLQAAQGELIAFQDSDDEWLPEKLETSVPRLLTSPAESGVFTSNMLAYELDGREILLEAPQVWRGVLINEASLDFSVFGIGLISALIRRECFERVGKFDENLRRYIDLDLFIRLSLQYDFIHSSQPLVRCFNEGRRISSDAGARVHARRYLIQKYHSQLSKNHHHLAGQFLLLAGALRDNHQLFEAFGATLKAFWIAPLAPPVFRKIIRYFLRR